MRIKSNRTKNIESNIQFIPFLCWYLFISSHYWNRRNGLRGMYNRFQSNVNLFIRFHKSQPPRSITCTKIKRKMKKTTTASTSAVHKNINGKKKYPLDCQIIIYDDINHLEHAFIAKNIEQCFLKSLQRYTFSRRPFKNKTKNENCDKKQLHRYSNWGFEPRHLFSFDIYWH